MLKITPLLSLLACVLVVAGCARGPEMIVGEIELNEAFAADFDLIDMHGEPATDERFEGKPMLIYFGFTSCPDVCPASLGVMVATLDAMGRDADRIQALFITIDPERDTPERLAEYFSFDPRILGLSGSEQELNLARERMRIFASKVPLPGSEVGYTMDHQSIFFLVDDTGRPIRAFDDGTPPQELARRLRDLIS